MFSRPRDKELPAGWRWSTIGEVTEPIGKTNPSTDAEGEFDYLDISSIDNQQNKIVEPKRYRGKDAPSRARQKVKSGDVLFSTVRTYLKNIAPVPEKHDGQIASTGFSVLRAKQGLHPKYLFYYTLTDKFLTSLSDLQRGTSYPAVRDSDVREQLIPIAPPEEQEKIVTKIEELFSQLDAATAALKRVQANLKRYKASVLKAACEGRLVPTEAELARREGRSYESGAELLERILKERRRRWGEEQRARGKDPARMKYPEPAEPDTEGLPELPEGWVWATVDQLAEVGTGATPLRSNNKYWENGTIPWVTSGALNDLYVNEASDLVTEAAINETNAKPFPAGTLLVAMYGEGKTRGKVSELSINAATNQAIAAIQLEGIAGECKPYVKIFFQKNYEDLRKMSSGGVQPNINLSIVRETNIPFAPLREQRQIVANVEFHLSIVESGELLLVNLLNRVNRIRQSVLNKAFTGKLIT